MAGSVIDITAKRSTSTALYKLEDISLVRHWDYSLPTLTQDRFTDRKPWNDVNLFSSKLYESFPILKEIDLTNLALMGGSVLSLLTDAFQSKDLDFFVITDQPCLNDEEAKEFAHDRVKRFIVDVFNHLKTSNDELKTLHKTKRKRNPDFNIPDNKFYKLDTFQVRRTRNVYTVNIPLLGNNGHLTIELIVTPYTALPDLFQHVDIDCTAIAFYANELYFSELAKFGFENLCFVVDGTTSGPNAVDRMIKYFNRGFDIIMPFLDVSKIRTNNFKFNIPEVIDMPQLTVVVNSIKDFKIFVSSLQKTDLETENALTSTNDFSGYDEAQDNCGLNAGKIIHRNIISLINGTYDDFIVYGEGSTYKTVFNSLPQFTDRMLVNSYATVKKDLYSNSLLNLGKLANYFTILKPSELLHRLLVAYAAKQEENGHPTSTIFDNSFKKHIESEIDELIERQIEVAKQKIRELEQTTQSTASIESRTITIDPEDFFGGYLNISKRRRGIDTKN